MRVDFHRGSPELDGIDTIKFAEPLLRARDAQTPLISEEPFLHGHGHRTIETWGATSPYARTWDEGPDAGWLMLQSFIMWTTKAVRIGERFRRAVRARLDYTGRPYQFAAWTVDAAMAIALGGRGGIKLLAVSRAFGTPTRINLKQLQHPLFVRPGTPDARMVLGTVVRREYGQLPAWFRPNTILDGGAYIGDTAAFYASKFPDAQVIAVEADRDNAELAALNLRPYGGRVKLREAALWDEDTTVRFSGAFGGAHIADSGRDVRALSVTTLMRDAGWDRIDLLKLDVEGAEGAVIRSGIGSWFDDVKFLILELHGTSEIQESVLDLIKAGGFVCSRYRSVWYCAWSE